MADIGFFNGMLWAGNHVQKTGRVAFPTILDATSPEAYAIKTQSAALPGPCEDNHRVPAMRAIKGENT